jgi:hypothetical protein
MGLRPYFSNVQDSAESRQLRSSGMDGGGLEAMRAPMASAASLQWPAYAWSKESWPGKHFASAEASSRCVETRLLLAAAGANVSALNQGGVTDG